MKKMEFSKKWLIGCVAVSLIYTTLSYILAFMGLDTVEALSIEVLHLSSFHAQFRALKYSSCFFFLTLTVVVDSLVLCLHFFIP